MQGEWRTTTLPGVSRGAVRSLVRRNALGGFGRAECHLSGATARPGSGGEAPGERQLERRHAVPECQLISEYFSGKKSERREDRSWQVDVIV